jgi:hypothetical protein
MHAFKKIQIGPRPLAAGVIATVAIWYSSLWLGLREGKGFVSNLSLFWNAVFTFLPFIASLFTVMLLIVYFRSGRPHGWWVLCAVSVAVSPWVLFILYLSSAGFL